MPIHRWFHDRLIFPASWAAGSDRAAADRVRAQVRDDTARKRILVDLLAAADVGISGFELSGSTDSFEFRDESAGTRAWIGLLPHALDAVEAGGTMIIDEIGTSLHPLLTARLIELFREPETNPYGAQLIFTTHDASLLGTSLGKEVLAREEIWFVEKDRNGASRLYPLSDFTPREGENRERRYLGGSYGAVPVVSASGFADAVRGTDAATD